MSKRIEETPAREFYLNLVRAQERFAGEFAALFREHGLTQAQFNVLRILIQGPKSGLPCQAIGEGLIHRVPDVTRLIDRMVSAAWVERIRSEQDRRVVLVRLTAKGRKDCESLYGPVNQLHRKQLRHLDPKVLKSLNQGFKKLLDE